MSFDDVFERMRKRAMRIVRDMISDLDEMEAWMRGMIEDLESTVEPERLLNERLSELSKGVLRPIASVHEAGSEIIITVDLSGSDPRTVEVQVFPHSIKVSSVVKGEYVRKAFGEAYWARNISRYEGEYILPVAVDPSTARYTFRAGILVIRVRKAPR